MNYFRKIKIVKISKNPDKKLYIFNEIYFDHKKGT